MNYAHNSFDLVELAINPDTLEPSSYSILECRQIVRGKEYKHWRELFSVSRATKEDRQLGSGKLNAVLR